MARKELSIEEACGWSRVFFFFNDTATTEIYTLSLHDALPICIKSGALPQQEIGSIKSGALLQREMGSIKSGGAAATKKRGRIKRGGAAATDRKSTRLNSSH